MKFGCCDLSDKVGVIIAQLGTPDDTSEGALRRYLKEFLWDPRVIEKNRIVWWAVLNLFVLRKRPARSAALYKRIWTEKGSPLMEITRKQTEGVRQRLQESHPQVEVAFAMRYGNPSIRSVMKSFVDRGVRRLLVFPMYPQYSGPTTASLYDGLFAALMEYRWIPTLRVVEPYYKDARYIAAQAKLINEAWPKLPFEPDSLILSYHGIPEEYIKKGDPYCCMCAETTKALLPQLQIGKAKLVHTYQSRFGKDPWLEPYTDESIEKAAREGSKKIAVACPGFTADCLETLDELGNEGREQFEKAGGEKYHLFPCLNDHPVWLDAMSDMIKEHLETWMDQPHNESSCVSCPVENHTGRKICAGC